MTLTPRTTASPISRMGASVEDSWRESSRPELLAGVRATGRIETLDGKANCIE